MLSFVRDPSQGIQRLPDVALEDLPLTEALLKLQNDRDRLALIKQRKIDDGQSEVDEAANFFKRLLTMTNSRYVKLLKQKNSSINQDPVAQGDLQKMQVEIEELQNKLSSCEAIRDLLFSEVSDEYRQKQPTKSPGLA